MQEELVGKILCTMSIVIFSKGKQTSKMGFPQIIHLTGTIREYFASRYHESKTRHHLEPQSSKPVMLAFFVLVYPSLAIEEVLRLTVVG
jgi:hypothetical protein